MEASHLSRTLEYLTDAAHLLHSDSPETSAHLLTQRRDLLYCHNLSPHENQRQHVCGACGHIIIAGADSSFSIKTSTRRRPGPPTPGDNLKATASNPGKVISCGACNRKTTVQLGPPPIRHKNARRKVKPDPTKSSKSDEAHHIAPKATSNASSKKRAKNRKAGLQALLSGQQQQRSSPLSLTDFMKK